MFAVIDHNPPGTPWGEFGVCQVFGTYPEAVDYALRFSRSTCYDAYIHKAAGLRPGRRLPKVEPIAVTCDCGPGATWHLDTDCTVVGDPAGRDH